MSTSARILALCLVLPACSLYFGSGGQDGGATAEPDARVTIDDAGAAVDAPVTCTVVLSYDWNDGTTQGWTASTSVSNVSGALVFANQGNGSLQAFGPTGPSVLHETDTISFTVRIDRYSTVTSPSKLVRSTFTLNAPLPGDGTLQFPLDVSTLAFGQPHVYTFPVSSGTFAGSLSRAAFLGHVKFASLLFADATFAGNTSAGTLDDFSIQTAACY